MNPFDSDELADELIGTAQQATLEPAPKLNPQLYPGGAVESSPTTIEYNRSPDRLHGDLPPNLQCKREQPLHRMMILLKSQGKSNREIAARMQKSESWVSQVLRQPWARQRIVQEINDAGRDGVQEVLRTSALDSVYRLIDLRDGEKTPATVVRAACDSLLDRTLGKAVQRTENLNFKGGGPEDLARIEEERRAIQTELQDYLGESTSEASPSSSSASPSSSAASNDER